MLESNKKELENCFLVIFKGLDPQSMSKIQSYPDRSEVLNTLQDYVSSCRNKLSNWLEELGIREQIYLGKPRVLNWLFMECPKEV